MDQLQHFELFLSKLQLNREKYEEIIKNLVYENFILKTSGPTGLSASRCHHTTLSQLRCTPAAFYH